jgi:hypothetical protein
VIRIVSRLVRFGCWANDQLHLSNRTPTSSLPVLLLPLLPLQAVPRPRLRLLNQPLLLHPPMFKVYLRHLLRRQYQPLQQPQLLSRVLSLLDLLVLLLNLPLLPHPHPPHPTQNPQVMPVTLSPKNLPRTRIPPLTQPTRSSHCLRQATQLHQEARLVGMSPFVSLTSSLIRLEGSTPRSTGGEWLDISVDDLDEPLWACSPSISIYI